MKLLGIISCSSISELVINHDRDYIGCCGLLSDLKCVDDSELKSYEREPDALQLTDKTLQYIITKQFIGG